MLSANALDTLDYLAAFVDHPWLDFAARAALGLEPSVKTTHDVYAMSKPEVRLPPDILAGIIDQVECFDNLSKKMPLFDHWPFPTKRCILLRSQDFSAK